MSTTVARKSKPKKPNRYSLVGPEAARALERGLAEARWYTPPVPRDQMRALLERRDGPAIRDTIIWFALLAGFGVAGYLLWGTGWAVLPFACYGIIYASSSDSRWHESGHGTAFKTDWMNNTLYEIASFMVLRESTVWRWSHTRHHSDTIIVGRDREIAGQRPVYLPGVLARFFNLQAWRAYVSDLYLHCTGRLNPEEATFIPDSERGKVFMRARLYVLIYAAVIALAVGTRSVLPLMFIGLPNLYGAWLMVVYGLTQHAGLAENVLDHRLNTRTVYMNPIHRYLYWNMGYHIEHHIFPLVPYHALPRLHELIKADMPRPYNGLIEAYREIIPTLIRQSRDADYYVKREVPARAAAAEALQATKTVTAVDRPLVDGWVEVCEGERLRREDVLRFDHRGQTYAIYRAADGRVYATDGFCTHGNAPLADGLVMGNIIECPKHNGRFDIRDGSPQRPPVCLALRTYDVRESNGRILLDVTSAHGPAAADTPPSHGLRVVSNDNVATFIKELVLEPDGAAPAPVYEPGDYLQFEIPPYEERSLRDVEVKQPFAAAWEAQRTFDLRVANPVPVRRDYSFASNPARERYLRFNVRIATPPRGVNCYAGVGSAYLFSLNPGDRVRAIGPFGSFHIQPGEREMVYLGGGSGMAPLRSHLSYLLETQKSARRISFWYGARSLQEMFYQDYFAALAAQNPNFTFHVALSEPRPEDGWKSYTGFIHEVLKREYLDHHPAVGEVEYYLCGPLPMVRAARAMLADMGVDPVMVAGDEF